MCTLIETMNDILFLTAIKFLIAVNVFSINVVSRFLDVCFPVL